MFPELARFTDLGILLLRLMVGLVFVNSGYTHLKDPAPKALACLNPSQSFLVPLNSPEAWA